MCPKTDCRETCMFFCGYTRGISIPNRIFLLNRRNIKKKLKYLTFIVSQHISLLYYLFSTVVSFFSFLSFCSLPSKPRGFLLLTTKPNRNVTHSSLQRFESEHHTSLLSLTFPELLLHPEDPEGWCCSYPRLQSCTVYQTRSNTVTFTIYQVCIELFLSIRMPSVQNLLMLLSYLSLEFICRAFASILAPMSPMAFPLMSNLASVELLPSAFSTMDRSLFSLESARDREVRGWREKEGGMCGEGEKSVDRVSVQFNLSLSTVYLWERATINQTHIGSSKRIRRFERCSGTWRVQDLIKWNSLWSENDTKLYKVSSSVCLHTRMEVLCLECQIPSWRLLGTSFAKEKAEDSNQPAKSWEKPT